MPLRVKSMELKFCVTLQSKMTWLVFLMEFAERERASVTVTTAGNANTFGSSSSADHQEV